MALGQTFLFPPKITKWKVQKVTDIEGVEENGKSEETTPAEARVQSRDHQKVVQYWFWWRIKEHCGLARWRLC